MSEVKGHLTLPAPDEEESGPELLLPGSGSAAILVQDPPTCTSASLTSDLTTRAISPRVYGDEDDDDEDEGESGDAEGVGSEGAGSIPYGCCLDSASGCDTSSISQPVFFLADEVGTLNARPPERTVSSPDSSRGRISACASDGPSVTDSDALLLPMPGRDCSCATQGFPGPQPTPLTCANGDGDVSQARRLMSPAAGSNGEELTCRICQEDGARETLVSPCLCSGTVGYVHVSCLNTWLQLTSRTTCELCGFAFPVTKSPAPLWEYLREPRNNMDLPNLVCDVACLVVLTPLLLSSVYLSGTGALRYESLGRAGSLMAVVTLLLALLFVYVSWACLAVVYHVRLWQAWRERHSIVSKLNEAQLTAESARGFPIDQRHNHHHQQQQQGQGREGSNGRLVSVAHTAPTAPGPPKCVSPGRSEWQAAAVVGADAAVLLTPITRLSGWMKVSNRISATSPVHI